MRDYSIADNVVAFSTERYCTDASVPYDGFNITHYSGDSPEHVHSCRLQLCRQLGISDDHLILPRQVHGTRIREVTTENLNNTFEDTDALITHLPSVCIGVSTADCVPLLFYDKRAEAVAAAHAGWRGTVARIGTQTLRTMRDAYGCVPSEVKCIVGPSIGPNAFEVGDEVYVAFAHAGFPMNEIAFHAHKTQKWHIDLWRANVWQLTQAGMLEENVHVSGICTYTDYSHFFSARRLGIKSGRIFSGIMIK